MTTAQSSEATEQYSVTSILVSTPQGRRLLLIGFLYTVIVGVTFSILHFATNAIVTVIASVLYIVFTGAFVRRRAPANHMVKPALVVFSGIPVLVTWGLVGVVSLVF
jgi:hypothetical protein